jgi:hypothetical protein
LREEDQERVGEVFAPYIEGHAGQYVYHLNGQDTGEHFRVEENVLKTKVVKEL